MKKFTLHQAKANLAKVFSKNRKIVLFSALACIPNKIHKFRLPAEQLQETRASFSHVGITNAHMTKGY